MRWRGAGQIAPPIGQPLRLRVQAQRARLYALSVVEPDETPAYARFTTR